MTIKELEEKQRELKLAIFHLVDSFERETGIYVARLTLPCILSRVVGIGDAYIHDMPEILLSLKEEDCEDT